MLSYWPSATPVPAALVSHTLRTCCQDNNYSARRHYCRNSSWHPLPTATPSVLYTRLYMCTCVVRQPATCSTARLLRACFALASRLIGAASDSPRRSSLPRVRCSGCVDRVLLLEQQTGPNENPVNCQIELAPYCHGERGRGNDPADAFVRRRTTGDVW